MRELSSGNNGEHSLGMIAAIIWDYDGTLVDTQHKNLAVTRAIIEQVTGVRPSTFPALQSLEKYAEAMSSSTNWRDFYKNEFGLDEAEIDDAGRKWTECQMRDPTPTPVFEGIRDVLHRLREVPHGIVSQSSRDAIIRVLARSDLLQHFGSIVGFEEVGLRRQKPEPDGLLHCINELARSDGEIVLYVGDHETDTASAYNANHVLQKNRSHLHIRSIAAMYSSLHDSSHWKIKPDYEARQVHDIKAIAESVKSLAALRQ
jgi:HAD superfamily hydrolase (TIGR01549 family)